MTEIEIAREELTAVRKALTEERYQHARTTGMLKATQQQHAAALKVATDNKRALDETRGTLGDLRDWVDGLTTCATVGELRARIAVLTGEEQAAERELSQRQELGAREGRTL